MGFWKTIIIQGRPKFWDKPGVRWKFNPRHDQALFEFTGSRDEYDQINTDPDTHELLSEEADQLSQDWSDPVWMYPGPEIKPGYCTISDLRDRGITPEAATDEELEKAICLAVTVIDSFCRRDFWQRQETYLVDGIGKDVLFLEDRPIIRILNLEIDGDQVSSDDYKVYLEEGYIKLAGFCLCQGIFPRGSQNVKVNGYFGFSCVPEPAWEASVLLAIDALKRLKNPVDLTAAAGSTDKAIGLRSARVEDISVDFEYPASIKAGDKITTGNIAADALLIKFRTGFNAIAV